LSPGLGSTLIVCHPTNGLALSKTAHWLFDRGFWSLTDDCLVLVAAKRCEEAGEDAQLLKPRAGQPIHLPVNPLFQPEPVCLRWHRERHGFSG
jgi:putative restriction endonuclease